MKAGPCREVFEVWQACVDGVLESPSTAGGAAAAAAATSREPADAAATAASRKEAAVVCADVTRPLFECLARHPEYYDDASVVGGRPAPAAGSGGDDKAAVGAAA
jgi:hypothetical protein